MSRRETGRLHGEDFAAAILAGGRSERLGIDKALLEIGGQALLDRIMKRLEEIFARILIVVQDGHHDLEAAYGSRARIVADLIPGKGPLGGIYTALEYSPAPHVFIMACDMPYPSLELVRRLLGQAPGKEAVVPRRGEYIEPLFAVYARSAREKIRARLDEDQLKIHDLLDDLDVSYMDEDEICGCDPEFRSFFNINTPEDLGRIY